MMMQLACLLTVTHHAYLAWGFLSAAYHVALPMNEILKNTLYYALLGTLIHSAGCVINDMLDRDLDRKVGTSPFSPDFCLSLDAVQHKIERSKSRPIASGAVTRTEASFLLVVLVAAIFYMFSTAGTKA